MHIHKQLPDVGVNFVTILQRVIANSVDRKSALRAELGDWDRDHGRVATSATLQLRMYLKTALPMPDNQA